MAIQIGLFMSLFGLLLCWTLALLLPQQAKSGQHSEGRERGRRGSRAGCLPPSPLPQATHLAGSAFIALRLDAQKSTVGRA